MYIVFSGICAQARSCMICTRLNDGVCRWNIEKRVCERLVPSSVSRLPNEQIRFSDPNCALNEILNQDGTIYFIPLSPKTLFLCWHTIFEKYISCHIITIIGQSIWHPDLNSQSVSTLSSQGGKGKKKKKKEKLAVKKEKLAVGGMGTQRNFELNAAIHKVTETFLLKSIITHH